MASAIKITKNYRVPTEPGLYYRLVCMTGKNKGLSYFVSGKRITMGRSDKTDIQVLDTKSSREHAELVFVNDKYVLSDLGSQNGVIVNDLKVTQHTLAENDKIIIGSTVFKYNIIQVEDTHHLTLVEEEEEDELDVIEEDIAGEQKKVKKKPNRKMMFLLLPLLALLLFMDDGADENSSKDNSRSDVENSTIDFRRKKINSLDKETRGKLGSIIHRGRRELREQNFFRAIEQFNLALIIDPGNGEASFLLKKSEQRLNDQIVRIQEKASNEESQRKYTSAVIQWCEIVRFLRNYPEDERYKQALKRVEAIEEKLGIEKGEHKCF